MGPDCCHTVEERWSAREGRAACMAAHGCRTGVLDSTNGFRYKGSDADDSRADDWRNTSRGDKRTRGLHAICARWGVASRADDWRNKSRSDKQARGLQRFALGGAWLARRRTVAGAPSFTRQPLAQPSTSSDDKLR